VGGCLGGSFPYSGQRESERIKQTYHQQPSGSQQTPVPRQTSHQSNPRGSRGSSGVTYNHQGQGDWTGSSQQQSQLQMQRSKEG